MSRDFPVTASDRKSGKMVKIAEFKGTEPFKDIGVTKFMKIEDLFGKEVSIFAVSHYENDKGEGVAVALKHPEHGDCYTCTHAVGIVDILKNEALKLLLEGGETVEGTFVRRKSKKSDRMVIALE